MDIKFSHLMRVFKRRHIKYINKKNGEIRHWILNKKIEDKGNNVLVTVFEVENNRPVGEPKFRELIRSRIVENKFVF